MINLDLEYKMYKFKGIFPSSGIFAQYVLNFISHSPVWNREIVYKRMSGQQSLKIIPGAVVCNEAEVYGDVSIGVRTVIHPKAKINAAKGPIIIGDGNLIEEQCVITNNKPGNYISFSLCLSNPQWRVHAAGKRR